MRRWLRLVPVVLMGSCAVAYVLARPALLVRVPHLAILEFPVGAAVVALCLWAALAGRRVAAQPVAWRRHEQVVRVLPDPALARDVEVLEGWVERGEDPEGAAAILARASSTDPREQERLHVELTRELTGRHSRRKREIQLTKHLEGV